MNEEVIGVRAQPQSVWRYSANHEFHDELIAGDGTIRPHWRVLADSLDAIGLDAFSQRWREGRRLLHDNGVTYNVYGNPQSADRPWPLDPIPLVVPRDEWTQIEAAMRQRVTLLNAVLGDLYDGQRLLHDGLIPNELVFRSPGFLRPCHGIPVPRGIYLHLYAADLARSPDGHWWVIADRAQAPSGAGYALENRLVSTRMMPDVFRAAHVHRLAYFFRTYRDTLRELVPARRENPRVVLLTPGPYNEAFFEHAFLARYLGYTLVEGGNLTVRDNRVFIKTLGGLLPVDLIVRRQDDSFCDQLELRADSMLGVPGLTRAVRAGNVAVANALGSGVIESAAFSAFLPALCRRLLDEDLVMPTVATWWCGNPDGLAQATSNLERLVIKPAFPGTDKEPIFGSRLSEAERRSVLEAIRNAPGDYVVQEQVPLSTVPVWSDNGLQQSHLVLRVYVAATGDSCHVMPGGLARVSQSLDSLVVSMQRGGGSKDTWVIADAPTPQLSLLPSPSTPLAVNRATIDMPSRVADNLFWLGRYAERAEMAVRVARALLPRLYQEYNPISVAGVEACVKLLSAFGYVPREALTGRAAALEQAVLDMIYESADTRGLGWHLGQLRRVAWLLRDRISGDAWQILNEFDRHFAVPSAPDALRTAGALNLLDHFVHTLSAFGGVVMESMTRGHGWRMLDIGRRLERSIQMVGLIRYGLGFGPAAEQGQLEVLLEIADSSLTYRSRYLTSVRAELVLDLILLDEANPRAIAFQLARLREHIDMLPESQRPEHRPREWRLATRLFAAVEVAELSDLMRPSETGHWAGLQTLIERLAAELPSVSDALTHGYFDHSGTMRGLTGA